MLIYYKSYQGHNYPQQKAIFINIVHNEYAGQSNIHQKLANNDV